MHHTVVSLNAAATQISTRVSPTDANLFLLSHLLALKHRILAFDIEYAATDVRVDFGAAAAGAAGVASFFNPARLVRAALGGGLVPRVVTDMRDARVDVDDRLRAVIGALVTEWAARMAEPVRATAAAAARRRPERTAAAAGRRAARRRLRARRQRREAVERRRRWCGARWTSTCATGARATCCCARCSRTCCGGTRRSWSASGSAAAAGNRRKGKGKGREDEVWEEDVFGEWASAVFGLEGVELDGDGMESS